MPPTDPDKILRTNPMADTTTEGPVLRCLDEYPGDLCAGPVEYREALSGTGRRFPRCDKHWAKRLKVQEGINRRYPATPPADFDPLYAGESWDED